jgi:hypothetical protein
MQAAITNPAALVRKSAQLLTQYLVITATRLVADYRPVHRYDPARQPLADIKQGLKMRDRSTLCSGRHHFLTADP